MQTIKHIHNKHRDIWIGFDDRGHVKDSPYLVEGFEKVHGGIRHLVIRYKSLDMKQIRVDLSEAYVSPRPYKLGQSCDGSIDQAVHALFYRYCNQAGISAEALYKKAYPDEKPPNYENVIKAAEWEGVEFPEKWGTKEFEGLIESLTEINNHSLVNVLDKEV